MKKSYTILYVYDMLLTKTAFNTNDIMKKFDCSSRTAKRYIADIRDYIKDFHGNLVVKYVSGDRSYRLVEKTILDRK